RRLYEEGPDQIPRRHVEYRRRVLTPDGSYANTQSNPPARAKRAGGFHSIPFSHLLYHPSSS
ncbi:MAG: hypothetical protein ACRENQ_04340, partial [Gemmatimonadaceae bacterium]